VGQYQVNVKIAVIGIVSVPVGSVIMNEEQYEMYDRQLRREQMSHKYAKTDGEEE
jgi:hypothetical protein